MTAICRRGGGTALLSLCLSSLFGQSDTGELRVSVKDASGAGVAASLELVNQSASTRQVVDLPPDGHYSFKSLPFGFYRVLVAKLGFATASELIEIRSAAPQVRKITLSLQTLRTSVTVTESDTLVDFNRTGSTQYVGSEDTKERPVGLPGRGLLELVAAQPGWAFEANGILHPRESEYDTQFVINGFPVYDNRSPAFAPPMETDRVESMKVYTSGIPAEFGQKLGGVVEVNTLRNSSPGFHGSAVAQGGSFDTAGGYLSGQYVAGRTTGTVSAEGFLTDHYLDPPTTDNFTKHGSSTSVTGTIERDLTDSNRLRLSAARSATWFLVPDDLLQQAAGQRQDRTSADTQGQAYYQHVFSPSMLGAFGGMVRDVSARLWSNPLATPIFVHQDRGFREAYIKANLSGHKGHHEWKTGIEARFASFNEEFGYRIAAYRVNGVRIFDRDLPPTYEFTGHAPDREQAAYVQDMIRLGNFTVSAGLRFDHYALLVNETGWSPRTAVSWHSRPLGLVLHASYDRTFDTPAFENILVSASPATAALNGTSGFYLPVRPSRGNYYEAGVTQAVGKRVRLDASYYRRDIREFKDDGLLLNTGVSFPIAFHQATIRGAELKLQVPRWGAFSGYVSYANTIGTAQFPISGGLFLDEGAAALLTSTERFPVTQDERNLARGWLRYQISSRFWTAWSGVYNSGLPVEGDLPATSFLVAQYGPQVVGKVNFDRGRVRPWFALNASLGADLWQRERRRASVQADVMNLTDRLNVITFAGLLSGTAVAAPRSFGVRLRVEF